MSLIHTDLALAEVYDLVLLDLDGVVYIGPAAVPGAAEALDQVRQRHVRTAFVTNNASRPPATVAAHLRELGVHAEDDDVVTSAQAAASMLAKRLPAGSKVLVVGGEGIYVTLAAVGLQPVASMDDEPLAVVQGFSPDVGWRLLAEGARAVNTGLPWIATNTDLTVPTPYGRAPGNGTLVAAIATATGIDPEVAGKPQPTLFHEAVERYDGKKPLVVGDRLDTDIEGAVAAGIDGLSVLTGVHLVRDLAGAAAVRRPGLIARDLYGLLEAHPAATVEGTRARVGSSVVDVVDGQVRVVAAGDDPMDLVRAGCVASWSAIDHPQSDTPNEPDAGPLLEALYRLEEGGPWGR